MNIECRMLNVEVKYKIENNELYLLRRWKFFGSIFDISGGYRPISFS